MLESNGSFFHLLVLWNHEYHYVFNPWYSGLIYWNIENQQKIQVQVTLFDPLLTSKLH